MPSLAITTRQFIQLFQETQSATRNFTKLTPEVLVERPRRILVFRALLNLSQPRFEALLEKSHGNTTKYERGIIIRMRRETANGIIAAVSNRLPANPNLQAALRNLETMKTESKGWFRAHKGQEIATAAARKGAISLLATHATDQERHVKEFLQRVGISLELNFPIEPTNTAVADVYIVSPREAIIQCRRITSTNRYTRREAIENLSYQGFRAKKYRPTSMIVAFVESTLPLSHGELNLLHEAYDNVSQDFDSLLRLLLGAQRFGHGRASRSQYAPNPPGYTRAAMVGTMGPDPERGR